MTTNDELITQETGVTSRVLVCDDSKVVRHTATKMLSKQFDVVLAEDGAEAWEKICSDDTIQVVFTDLGMPRLDGYGLIERVRASNDEGIRNLPMIVITGADEQEKIRRQIFELGATDFITKPFKATTLIARADAHASYRRVNKVLQENVNIDLLTGSLNRKGLDEQLFKDISFVNRHSENLAVMIFELDRFSSVCDRIGQASSEKIIKEVAIILNGAVRKEDSVGRDSLAKFIVSLPMVKAEGVIKLAKRLCTSIEAIKLKIDGKPIPLSASAGVSTVSKGSHADVKDIIQCAENALANAKIVGNGEVQLLKLEAGESVEVASIDALLEQIEQGDREGALEQMRGALRRLAPLVALLTDKQKQQLLSNDFS